MDQFSVSKTIKGTLPRVPFIVYKNTVLGKKYSLSLVFAGDTRMRKLNQQYRKKDYVPDILSFPLSKTEGEIYINLRKTYTHAKIHEMTKNGFLAFLFIHGMLHLKGMGHGSRMESEERKYKRFFKLA
ncbi:MAG: rRNA maturation RNase YbeY [Candidatus Paceibacterota bacterium]